MQRRRAVAVACLCASLAACGGGGGGSAVTPGSPGAANVAQVVVSILIPQARASAARRRPRYISVATKSLALVVNGAAPVLANLAAGAPGCTATAQGDLSCTVTAGVAPGSDTFEETLYDQLQPAAATTPSGNALSHAKQIVTVKGGQPNALALTLNGVVAAITLRLPANLALVQGTAAVVPLTVAAQDAGGNTIIADPYDTPIALASGDAAMALSSATVSSPADAVSVTYSGAPGIAAVTITAGSGSSVTASVTLPPPKTRNATDWATFGFDNARTGSNPAETVLGTTAASQGLTLKWSAKIPGATFADTQPLVATNVLAHGVYRDLVIVGDERGGLTAFNAADGGIVWNTAAVGAVTVITCGDIPDHIFGITGTPALDRANNRLYAVGGPGKMYAVDLSSGAISPAWGPAAVTTDPLRDHVYSAVTFDAANHRAFVGTASYCDVAPSAEGVRAVDTNGGTVVAGPLYFNPPAAATLSAGIWGPGGFSLDPRGSGALYGAIGNTGAGEGGVENAIVQLTSGMALSAYNAPPTTLPDADFGGSPVLYVDGDACLVVEQKTGISYAYDLDAIALGPTQTIAVGSSTTFGVNLGTPAYAGHVVYLPNASNGAFAQGMLAFDVQPGCRLSLRWSQTFGPGSRRGNTPFTPPTVANGVVYAGDGVGDTLYALDARTGTLLWHFTVDSPLFAAPSVAGGQVYAVSWTGTLYAFGP